MQSAHLALEIARRCVASGRLAKAALFLHDVNRELEQRIIKEQFLADPLVYALGTMKGEAGDLTGGKGRGGAGGRDLGGRAG